MKLSHAIFTSMLVAGGSGVAAGQTLHALADPQLPQVAPVLTELRAAAEAVDFVVSPLDSVEQPRGRSRGR